MVKVSLLFTRRKPGTFKNDNYHIGYTKDTPETDCRVKYPIMRSRTSRCSLHLNHYCLWKRPLAVLGSVRNCNILHKIAKKRFLAFIYHSRESHERVQYRNLIPDLETDREMNSRDFHVRYLLIVLSRNSHALDIV